MNPDIRQFTNNKMTLEEQLGLRFYNLEQTYRPKFIIENLLTVMDSGSHIAFDDEFVRFSDDPVHRMYVHSIQIVRYFGEELVTRFITFNYQQEVMEIREVG